MSNRSKQRNLKLNGRKGIDAKLPQEQASRYITQKLEAELQIAHNVYSKINDLAQIPCDLFLKAYNIRPTDYIPDRGSFTMMYRDQVRYIRRRITKGKLKGSCLSLWLICMETAERDTGEVPLNPHELAEEAGLTVEQTKKAMKLLDQYGAVWTFKKGWRVVYRCNPLVGWNGSRESEIQKTAWWVHDEMRRQIIERVENPQLSLEDLSEQQKQSLG